MVLEGITTQVYQLIRNDILERKLKPGERINTKQIAADNGISVLPVRNALQHLTTDGLVQNKERVGFFVKQYSEEEFKKIMDVRIMFEVFCLTRFGLSIKRDLLIKHKKNLLKAQTAKEMDDADHSFHELLVKASNNEFLLHEYEALSSLFAIGVYSGENEKIKTSRDEHLEIVEALLDKNLDKAEDLLLAHLNKAREEIISSVKQ